MLEDANIEWTLIGHSERRQYYGETDEVVAKKVEIVQASKVKASVCIGETLEERNAGKTTEVVTRQLKAAMPMIKDWDRIVIAYEPVWAIGTGVVATPKQAQETHAVIRKVLTEGVGADIAAKVRVVYGGSVTDQNCNELGKEPDIDGYLVGGASLKPVFLDIIKSSYC
eukprot:GHVU01032572.1.p1 GENE.GHVU01032572.1~~GHVU01032572.1.p1  ORF type:complete len:169 (+),score=33.73 GHVU01032572.1:356-862(+)